MKKILFLLVLILLARVAVVFSPELSIFRLSSAIRHRDVQLFEKYADVHSVAQNLVHDQIAGPITGVFGNDGVGGWLTNGINSAVGPALVTGLEKEIRSAVFDGAFNPDHPDDNSLVTVYRFQKELGFDQFAYSGMKYGDRQVLGEKTQLSLSYVRAADGYELVVKVELIKAPGEYIWKVSRILNPELVMEELRNHPAPASAATAVDHTYLPG